MSNFIISGGSSWVIPQACMFQKCCNMNHIAKIYCWAEISAQNKLQFSFTYGLKVVFVKNIIFYFSGGLFWDFTEALIFHGGFSMSHSGKIQSRVRLLGKNRLYLSIIYYFIVIFVQRVKFGLFRGGHFEAIWGLYIWQREHIWSLVHSLTQLLSI